MLIIAAILALAPSGAGPSPGRLPPYVRSLRCAGLSEAMMEIASTDKDRAPWYDAAMFWGLAASEAARKDGLPSARFKQDQLDAEESAEAELKTGDVRAQGEASQCLRQVPPLKDEKG
jgi:hypothetical protein